MIERIELISEFLPEGYAGLWEAYAISDDEELSEYDRDDFLRQHFEAAKDELERENDKMIFWEEGGYFTILEEKARVTL